MSGLTWYANNEVKRLKHGEEKQKKKVSALPRGWLNMTSHGVWITNDISELQSIMRKQKILISSIFLFYLQTELRSCTACGDPIADKYVLEVGGCTWHGSCLKCCICLSPLDRQTSCFLRERQVYCKADYAK